MIVLRWNIEWVTEKKKQWRCQGYREKGKMLDSSELRMWFNGS